VSSLRDERFASRQPTGGGGTLLNPGGTAMKKRAGHDPERTERQGMSSEASGVDAAETMASTGDEEGAFREIASGTATGLGIDRGESIGTGGLAADEDRDDVEEGDPSRIGWEPFYEADRTSERFDLEGRHFGWRTGADLDERGAGFQPAGPDEEGKKKSRKRKATKKK
jgi:hypothetical protein